MWLREQILKFRNKQLLLKIFSPATIQRYRRFTKSTISKILTFWTVSGVQSNFVCCFYPPQCLTWWGLLGLEAGRATIYWIIGHESLQRWGNDFIPKGRESLPSSSAAPDRNLSFSHPSTSASPPWLGLPVGWECWIPGCTLILLISCAGGQAVGLALGFPVFPPAYPTTHIHWLLGKLLQYVCCVLETFHVCLTVWLSVTFHLSQSSENSHFLSFLFIVLRRGRSHPVMELWHFTAHPSLSWSSGSLGELRASVTDLSESGTDISTAQSDLLCHFSELATQKS